MRNTTSTKKAISTIALFFSITSLFCQENPTRNSSTRDDKNDWAHSMGSSVFLLGNLDTEEPPLYFQLNYGHYLNTRDVIIMEAITWAYYHPLGIQLWESSDDVYPGKIRSFGVGVGYQRFHWKGLYSTIQATPFLQNFYDTEDEKIQSGFQLWCQLRTGYRIELFKERRWFLEPSFVINYWPVNTNFPESFEQIESKWPNYYLFEPGLHFGFRF